MWELAHGGVQVKSHETVAEFLRRWFAKRVDHKRSTRKGYEDHIERVFIPTLCHLKMRDLRTRHIQDMFKKIWADNKIHQHNREAADEALAAERAAHTAWRTCTIRPRPTELRQHWNAAKTALQTARSKPRHITGPGTQLKNWAKTVVLPKYVRPKPPVWTDERVTRWRTTGKKPGKVMVWTPEQTGTFLDAVAPHRLYPMFHLMVFRGLRRGEVAGLPWSETNLTNGTVHISEQLVAASYDVWEDTPKSESGARTISLDSQPTNYSSCGGSASKPSARNGTAPTSYGSSTAKPSPTSRAARRRKSPGRTPAWSSRGRTDVPTTPSTCRKPSTG
nr:hypothetical protein [Streptomyces sp. S465]